MDNQWIFVLKLLIISAVLSGVIKYVLPWFTVPATSEVVLGLILAPSIFLGCSLLWRGWQFQKQERN